jgi:DNA-binding transcriptional ArsR family regulator
METTTTTILKALADNMRLAIVRCLADNGGELRSCDVVEKCSTCATLSQPAMSHHFKKLIDAGIVKTQKSGTENLYSLDRQRLEAVGIDAGKL